MTKEMYEYLDTRINETITTFGTKETESYRERVKYSKIQFNAFCWGIYHATVRLDSSVADIISKADLESTNILTALKKILAKYK